MNSIGVAPDRKNMCTVNDFIKGPGVPSPMAIKLISSLHLRWTILTASGFTKALSVSLIVRRILIFWQLRNSCLFALTLSLFFWMTRLYSSKFTSSDISSSKSLFNYPYVDGSSNSVLNFSIFECIIFMSSDNSWLLYPRVRKNSMSSSCWF